MLVKNFSHKKLFLFLVFIFIFIIVFILKNIDIISEKKEYTGLFFKKPFPLVLINPQNNLIDSTSFLITVENVTNINSFFSKLESTIGSIEGKLIKVTGELLTSNGTRFLEISDNPEKILILDRQNTYPSEQTKKQKTNFIGKIVDLQCVMKNNFSENCFLSNLYENRNLALRIFKNKEYIDYLLKINDNKILNNFLENDFEKTVKVYGDYYYQNGFNVINLDSISTLK
tara:strand:+ start:1516 stop:2202 length:687 start_codon:yes stop_codon:yes gene_type:complete